MLSNRTMANRDNILIKLKGKGRKEGRKEGGKERRKEGRKEGKNRAGRKEDR